MNNYSIAKVDKVTEQGYSVIYQNGSLCLMNYELNNPILEWIEENKDSGLFEYKESYRNYNKMQEFKEFLSQNNPDTCEIRLFENGVITHVVVKNFKEVQDYLQKKINNGDVFDYELDGNKTILDIPKSEAQRLHSQIEKYQEKVKSYKNHYINAIETATNQSELDAIVFQITRTIAGRPFTLGEITLDFVLSEGMSIVDTF